MNQPEFDNADPHERTLWYFGFVAWISAVEMNPLHPSESANGTTTHYEIDLHTCPYVEICDLYVVRRFSIDLGPDGQVAFTLSDPIRNIDPVADETLLDHAVVIYPDGTRQRIPMQEHSPERVLNLIAALIPRRNREALVGDIYEDLHELRVARRQESYIMLVIVWQLLIAIVNEAIPRVWRFFLKVLLIQQVRDAFRHWLAR